MLYDRDRYAQEIFFDELAKGQTFPPLAYRFEPDDVTAYLDAVGDTTPAFRDDTAARAAGFDGALLPSLATVNYGFVYQAMGRRPPTGFLNTAVSFDFRAPVSHGARLTLHLSVDDTFVKREKKFVILEAVVRDEAKQVVTVARIDCIFPA